MAHLTPDDIIDWDLAVSTATRLQRPGPDVDRDEVRQVVDELRRAAAISEGHVREYTRLHTESATAPVLVVDRRGWVQANADGFSQMMRPLLQKMVERRQMSTAAAAVGSRVTALETGGLLAFLSSKVLGQFDPFFDGDGASSHGGRMLLVAPNVVEIERELGVDPSDFRLWVCLHEETHRVQFTAVPWLRHHVLAEMEGLVGGTDLDPDRLLQMLRGGAETVGRILRGDRDASLVDIVSTPEQKAAIERLTAVMSLLEGHADVVMDGVGPQVVPSVEKIRAAFEQRRGGAGPIDQMVRRLLGLDAKLRQYRDGAAFVRGVLDRVGMDGLNAVWTSPETLPTKTEIDDPGAWVRRVHG